MKNMDSCILSLFCRFERAGADFRPLGYCSGWRRFGNTLVAQIRGGGYILETEGAGRFSIERDAGFLIPEGMRTRVSVPPGETATTVFAHFHCHVLGALDLFSTLQRPIVFRPDAAAQIGACNMALIEHQAVGVVSPRTSADVSARLAELVRLAVGNCPELDEVWRDSGRRRLLPVMRYIQEHIAEPLCRRDLAAVAHLSVPRLHVLFSRAFGLAPMDFVRSERVRRARELLHWTDRPVSEVALACGFDDALYFSRAFRRAEGVPPSRFRREVRSAGG